MATLLFLMLFQGNAKPVAVEELFSTILHSTVTLEGKTFWISIEGRGAGRTNDLYRFDHATGKIFKINTDFTTLDVVCRLVPMTSGFALYHSSNMVYTFNTMGDLQEQFPMSSLKNCPASIRKSELQPIQASVAAFTYRDLDHVEDLFLATVNFEERTFDLEFVKKNHDGYSFWTWHNGACYFVNAKNGEISKLNHKFQVQKVMVPAQTPYLSVKEKNIADLIKADGYSPYLDLVRTGSIVGDTMYFWRFHAQTKDGLVLHQLALKKGQFSVINHGRLILAKFNGGVLEFNRDEQAFALRIP
jgi:hypothetical protein